MAESLAEAIKNSAQPCGCDEGAEYRCGWHKVSPISAQEFSAAIYCATCGSRYCVHTGTPEFVERASNMKLPTISFSITPVGIGGAPSRATTLPEEGSARKQFPVASGVLDYFPDALVAIANVSWKGNEQHNPGQPLHWAREKSFDESDTMIRHFLQRGTFDTDGTRHSAKMAWRALAILQKEIEGESR